MGSNRDISEYKDILHVLCDWMFLLDENHNIVDFISTHDEVVPFSPGQAFSSLFLEHEKDYIYELFHGLEQKSLKFIEKIVWFVHAGQKPIHVHMSGCLAQKQDADYKYVVTISKTPRFDETISAKAEHCYYLLDRMHFSPLAKRFLQKALEQKKNYFLSFIQIRNIVELTQEVPKEAFHKWHLKIGSILRAHAVGGDAAAFLTTGKFALIHAKDVGTAELKEAIIHAYKEFCGFSPEVSIHIQTLDFAMQQLSEIDAFRCLDYLLLKFAYQKEDLPFVIDIDQSLKFFVQETLDRISLLRKTIDEQNFDVVFQPIFDLRTNEIHHYEALSRVTGDDTPSKIIRFAEETGMIQDFDLAVFQKTLEILREERKADGGDQLVIAVNISAQSLESRLFLNELELIIEPFAHLRPQFMFEITETTHLEDFEQANIVIQNLRNMGHKICLDDVGSGSTSFFSLNHLEVDFAKIEGDYIRKFQEDPRQKSILETIVKACQKLKIPMIAEKIENETQLNYVKELGVEFGQGFYLGRPSTFEVQD